MEIRGPHFQTSADRSHLPGVHARSRPKGAPDLNAAWGPQKTGDGGPKVMQGEQHTTLGFRV